MPNNMTRDDYLLAGGSVVAFFAAFFPWLSVSLGGGVYGLDLGTFSISGTSHFMGWVYLIADIAVIALLAIRLFAPTMKMPSLPMSEWARYMVLAVIMAV